MPSPYLSIQSSSPLPSRKKRYGRGIMIAYFHCPDPSHAPAYGSGGRAAFLSDPWRGGPYFIFIADGRLFPPPPTRAQGTRPLQDQRVGAATLWNPPLGTYGFQTSLYSSRVFECLRLPWPSDWQPSLVFRWQPPYSS